MSATVTELRPADQATAERMAKREATEARVREQAKRDNAEIARRNGAERLTSQARHVLRREGLPCTFVPAYEANAVAETIAAAVATWDLDAAVAALRPYASAPIGYLAAVGGAASAHYAALMSDTRDEIKGREEQFRTSRGTLNTRPLKMTAARRDAKAMVAEVARAVKPTRKAVAKRASSGPRKSADEITVAIAAWNAEVATFERDQGAGWRARRDAAQFGGEAPAPISKPAPVVAPQPEPTEEESVPMTETAPEPVETTPPAATIPQPLADYLGRLVNGSKLAYASALVAHLFTGAGRPDMPATDWAPKVLAKVERYAGRQVKR